MNNASTLFLIAVLSALINLRVVQSSNRRQFLSSSFGSTCIIISTAPALADGDDDHDENEEIASLLDAKTMYWNGPSWTAARYRSSSLKQSSSNYAPPASNNPVFYPTWMEGYHKISYKFKSASFPQGRKILTLRTPGAGLGSCMMLPNIGYNPSKFPIHFTGNSDAQVYEDLMYNIPRKFEAFWTQAKVLGVQTNQISNNDGLSSDLATKCLVTGEGCIAPNARPPSTRVAIDFNGPTRRGGRVTQSSDATMLDSSVQYNGEDSLYTTKTFSQYNVNQDLQLFYKEVTSLRRKENGVIDGKVRVAAFLPNYIRGMDVNSANDGDSYDDNEAVAIYDYNIVLQTIDETEAATL